jgi:cytochrome c oxidase subunit IV
MAQIHDNGKPRSRPNYWMVLVALVVLTAIEVTISYITGGIKIPILVGLAIIKAALVVLYFMHLKFDARIYALVFIIGLVLIVPLWLAIALTNP